MNKVNFILYTEDPPMKDGVVSTGLARVNKHILDALEDSLYATATSHLQLRITLNENFLEPNFVNKCKLIYNCRNAQSLIPHLWRKFFGLKIVIPRRYINKLINNSREHMINVVLVPVGVDFTIIKRANQLAKALNLELYIYLVDEPYENSVLNEKIINRKEYVRSLKLATKIFSITDGLVNYLELNYQIKSTKLNLPFKDRSTQNIKKINQNYNKIVFIGNTSHFYQDGLIDCAESIALLQNFSPNLKLICTIRTDFIQTLQMRYGEIVKVERCETNEELKEMLSSALATFVPYSFDSKYMAMEQTSFPSKIIEYMAYSKNIVFYGPKYSSPAREINRYNILHQVNEKSIEKLTQLLKFLIENPSNRSSSFKKVLLDFYGYEVFREILTSNVKENNA
jgi:hypothetical protein